METIQTIKDWLKFKKSIQFEILEVDSQGVIIKVSRVKDNNSFKLNTFYPALRHNWMKITDFDKNQIIVKVEYLTDNSVVAAGFFPINDLTYMIEKGRGGYTDRLSEKNFNNMKEQGFEFYKNEQRR